MTNGTRSLTLTVLAVLAAAAPAAAVKRRAFATSVTGSGNLSSWPDAGGQTGLAAGDQICRARAAAASLPNANTYRAWLSTSATDAYCHVQGLTGTQATACNGAPQPGAGPWYLVNGITNYTASLAELTGDERVIFRPVTLDENADEILDDVPIWTGTYDNGAVSSATCSDWTSASSGVAGSFGFSYASATNWTYWAGGPCSNPGHLLCLEPGASDAAQLGWSPGALVFVTSTAGKGDLGAWPQAGGATGVAAGDAICQSLASAAHLPAPASFVSWLSTAAGDAADRLTLTTTPYRRPDAFTVANNKADLLDGAVPNSIHVDEMGGYIRSLTAAWTGTLADGTVGSGDCDAWTSELDTDAGVAGRASFARNERWTEFESRNCGGFARLYCFSNVVTLFWDGFELTGDTSRWSSVVP